MQKLIKKLGISVMTFLLVITGFVTNVSADNSEIYHNDDMSIVVMVNRNINDNEVSLDFETNTDESISIDDIKIDEVSIKNKDYRYTYVVGENGNYKFIVEYTRDIVLEKENEEQQIIQRKEKFEFSLDINELVSNDNNETSNVTIDEGVENKEEVQSSNEDIVVDTSPTLDTTHEISNEVINGISVTTDNNGVRTLSDVPKQEDLELFITENEYIIVDNETGVITIETSIKPLYASSRVKRSAGSVVTTGKKVVPAGDTITVTWRAEPSYYWQLWGGISELYVDGNRAYCLEPSIFDSVATNNASFTTLDTVDGVRVHPDGRLAFTPTHAQKKNVELISNYGRKYPGHETDAYEWATKKLIWIEMGWDVNGGPNVDAEMAEIRSLIAQHSDVPSWNGETLQVRKGEVVDLSETGINKFNINTRLTYGLEVIEDSGNSLKIRVTDKEARLALRKKAGSEEGTSFVYSDGYSQKVADLKLQDPTNSFIKFEVKSGNLEITKKNNFDELLEGVTYEFSENADMSNPFITQKTNADGKVRVDDIDEGKVIYYREKATITGHVLDTTIYNATIISGETVNQSRTNTAVEGQAKLVKTDGNKKLLEGVVFGVYKFDGTLVEELTTDANGEILTSKLRFGDYYFEEHKSLDDYWTDKTPIYFSIREHKEVKHVTMANRLIQVHLEWNKTNEDGLPLAGVGFKIRNTKTGEFVTLSHADGKNVIEEDTWYTDANGDVFVKGLIGAGEYELVEVAPLDGYQPIKPLKFTVDDKQDYIDLGTLVGLSLDVGDIVNYWNRGSLKIAKLDIDTKEHLSEFGFNLYDLKNNLIGYYETGADGTVTIDDLKYGYYVVEEIKVGGDYGIDPQKARQEVFIEEHGKTYEVTFENKHADIKTNASFVERDKEIPNIVTLVDVVKYTDLQIGKEYVLDGTLMYKDTANPVIIDGELIKGQTVFTPSSKDGSVEVVFTFDASKLESKKLVVFEDLSRENQSVVVHHDINDIDQTVEIPEVGTTLTYTERDMETPNIVTLTDEVRYSGLVIGKEYTVKGQLQDGVTGLPLLIDGKTVDGETTFTATEKNGSVEVVFTFDQNKLETEKIVAFEHLYVGERLIAVHADLEDKEQTIEIITYHILKKDIDTKEVLKDAEFTRYDLDGNIIEVLHTDENGVVEFKLFKGEVNTAKETGAPLGYKLSDEVVTMDTNVNEDGTLFVIEYYNELLPDDALPATGISNTPFILAMMLIVLGGLMMILSKPKFSVVEANTDNSSKLKWFRNTLNGLAVFATTSIILRMNTVTAKADVIDDLNSLWTSSTANIGRLLTLIGTVITTIATVILFIVFVVLLIGFVLSRRRGEDTSEKMMPLFGVLIGFAIVIALSAFGWASLV